MDSETRKYMKNLINSLNSNNTDSKMELFTDWVYDRAYRKGWENGFWRQESDYSHQTRDLRKRKKRK